MLNFKIFHLLTWISIMLFFNTEANAESTQVNEINHQDVINFVNEVKSKIDTTINPCDNFFKYACGKIKDLDSIMIYPNYETYFIKLFIDNEPTSHFEKIARKQYMDCQKSAENPNDLSNFKKIYQELDFLSTLGNFPVQRNDLTSKTVAELETQMTVMLSDNFFKIHPLLNTEKNQFKIEPNYKKPSIIDNIRNIFIALSNNSTDSNEIQETVDKVIEFHEKLNQLCEKNTTAIEIKSFDELKQLLPSQNFDWNTFLETFYKIWDLKKYDGKYKISVINYDCLKKILILIDSTDIQTIINYQVYQFMSGIKMKSLCSKIIFLNRQITLKKFWDENLTNRTIERYINFLDEFKLNFNKIVQKIPKSETNSIQKQFLIQQNILLNHTKLITENDIQQLYKDYNLNKPYKSLNEFIKNGFRQSIDEFFPESDFNKKFVLNNYAESIEFHIKNKPYFYFYKILQFHLWLKFLYLNNDNYNTTLTDNCFKQINDIKNETSNYEFFDQIEFINAYAAIKLTQTNTLTENEILNKEINLIKDLIDPEKLFFISMGQMLCQKGVTKYDSPTFLSFSLFEEFSKAFSCPTNTKMNHYNENHPNLEFCYNGFPYIKDIIPCKIKEC